MKLRHAAALALVGWYLVIPPTSRDYPSGDVDAPLSEWAKRPTTYRDKAECEHVLDQQRRLWNAKNRQLKVRFFKQAQCVATDDPRLKEKGICEAPPRRRARTCRLVSSRYPRPS
jgi:hypothetical protein